MFIIVVIHVITIMIQCPCLSLFVPDKGNFIADVFNFCCCFQKEAFFGERGYQRRLRCILLIIHVCSFKFANVKCMTVIYFYDAFKKSCILCYIYAMSRILCMCAVVLENHVQSKPVITKSDIIHFRI